MTLLICDVCEIEFDDHYDELEVGDPCPKCDQPLEERDED
jgi:hypothetical protein